MIFDLLQLFQLLILKAYSSYRSLERKWQGVLGYSLFIFCCTLSVSFVECESDNKIHLVWARRI
jgi:hypothetical protein